MPAGAILTVSYSVYADGVMVDADDVDVTVNPDGSVDDVVVNDVVPFFFGKDAKITVEPTKVETNKVIVKYVDADGKALSTVATTNDEATVASGSLQFNLDSAIYNAVAGTYKITGVKTEKTGSVTPGTGVTVPSVEAKGDNLVTVTVTGLSAKTNVYGITNSTSHCQRLQRRQGYR